MPSLRTILMSLIAAGTTTVFAQTNVITFQSTEKQTALLELYTSEGCSSCPPADVWLGALQGKAGLWTDFVPVAFHVDYWDNLGWRDPWGSGRFADRQREHAANWHTDTLYTPEFVLNANEWRGWSTAGVPPSSQNKPGVLTAKSSDGLHWQIAFAPTAAKAADQKFEVNVALLGNGLGSNVKAGENNGHHLKHDFTVLNLAKASLTRSGDVWTGEITLNPSGKQEGSPALAVWVTQAGHLEPLQATGGNLPAPR